MAEVFMLLIVSAVLYWTWDFTTVHGPTPVKFTNGKFGIKKSQLGIVTYLGNDGAWWMTEKYVVKYCMFNTAEEAQKVLRESTAVEDKTYTGR